MKAGKEANTVFPTLGQKDLAIVAIMLTDDVDSVTGCYFYLVIDRTIVAGYNIPLYAT